MFTKAKNKIWSAIQPSKAHIEDLKGDINMRLANLLKDRDAGEQKTLEDDFAAVLQAWGIADQEIPHVLSMLKIRACLFLLPLLLAVVVIWQAEIVVSLLVTFLCLLVSVAGLSTTLWRSDILKFRRFIPFRQWLCEIFNEFLLPFGLGKK